MFSAKGRPQISPSDDDESEFTPLTPTSRNRLKASKNNHAFSFDQMPSPAINPDGLQTPAAGTATMTALGGDMSINMPSGNLSQVSLATMRKFAWCLVSAMLFIIGVSCICARFQNSNQSSAQFMLMYVFIIILVWATTLSSEISWPLRVACYALPWGLATSNMFAPWSFRTFDGYNTVASVILMGSTFVSTPLYKILQLSQRCMQRDYGTKTIENSMQMLTHLASAAPVVYYFAVYQMSGYVEVLFYNNEYAEFTPLCNYTEGSYGVGNTEYKCLGSLAADDRPVLDGNHVLGHLKVDIVELPLFKTPTTHLTYEEAVEWASEISENPLPTTETQYLTYHDFRRFKAEELSTDGYQEATVALFQGTAFLLCLIVGEIFMRISKTTAKDVVEFKFSKLECAILLCSIVQGFISLGLGSLKGKLFAEGVFFLGSIFMMTIISQFLCLYCFLRRLSKKKKYEDEEGEEGEEGEGRGEEVEKNEEVNELREIVQEQNLKIMRLEQKLNDITRLLGPRVN
ncbi:hypothetical protein TrVE_jg2942 [Triparma verrucosa]|uniref:Uncharacterized protein n=1 Tax=Triparma verrucosa TaxID=1606542 RepID=A0A9W7FK65_9STRA|nr:hypothetical protein TrVE_jg2942 [Triparma verrucosa]